MTNTIKKIISVYLAISFLAEIITPHFSFATSGPQSPEFSNFESVSTNNMVDPFSGSFTYNIPLLDVPGPNGGGYPLSLSYHSGSSPEEEASWVGYGWTLNAGSIMCNKQGFPDDANGEGITYYNKIGKNWTFTAGAETYLKAFNIPQLDNDVFVTNSISEPISRYTNTSATLGLSFQAVYNNRMGLSLEYSPYFDASITMYSCHVGIDEGQIRYTKEINPGEYISKAISVATDITTNWGLTHVPFVKGIVGRASNIYKSQLTNMAGYAASKAFSLSPYSSPYTSKSYTLYNYSAPTVLQDYRGFSIKGNLGAWGYFTCVPVGYGGSVFGSYTQQSPVEINEKICYGYIYSHNATHPSDLMDYTVEKQDVYNLRDNFLPIPYSAPDMYTVAAEGIGGTFRAYSSTIGHFRPNEQDSRTNSYSFGLEIGAGQTESVTFSAQIGQAIETQGQDLNAVAERSAEAVIGGGHELKVEKWEDINGYHFSDNQTLDEPYYFRFLGDMGGLSYNNASDYVKSAELSGNTSSGFTPSYPSSLNSIANAGNVITRASYIGYHTNSQMLQSYQRYSQRTDADLAASFSRESDDHIGEFSITNKSGNKYVYALPVLEYNECEFSVDVSKASNHIEDKSIVYKNISTYIDDINIDGDGSSHFEQLSASQKIVGSHKSDKHANAYLLTEVTASNYIDVTHNGPTRDDVGGWTKFYYTKQHSAFQWRMPYNGLYYNPGNLADPNDDMGSFSSGLKEVYYLDSIETATHRAVFTRSNRHDGISCGDIRNAGEQSASIGNDHLQKLDKITLYSLTSNGARSKLIKTIHFDYDYSTWPGIPNTTSIGEGKLTLTKIYAEYADVTNAEISPYKFEYIYPTTDYPSKYDDIESYKTGKIQTPSYSIHASDRWGVYRENGEDLDDAMFPWNEQTTSSTFDPAAWQLKKIVLPTQGEIHIQYEQNDYQYVQDRKSMVMAKLTEITPAGLYSYRAGEEGARYYIDLAALGIEGNEEAINTMKNQIQKIMIDGVNGREPEKAHFKFLYSLDDNYNPVNVTLDACNTTYVDGYINVDSVDIDEVGLYVILGSGVDENDWDCPRDAAVEFYKSCMGNASEYSTDNNGNCVKSSLINGDDFEEGVNATSIGSSIYELIDHATSNLTGNYNTVCNAVNPALSYIKLPLPYEKKGGGIRVKRLLTYDKGIETNNADAMLYGHEYLYVDYDGRSSGIASNEPIEGGEENALVGFLQKRNASSQEQTMAAGFDKSQFEGPIGQNILPSPTVGYSRVLIRNIHSGPTNDGIQSFEYYTTKDYPFDKIYQYTLNGSTHALKGVDYTDLNLEQRNKPNFGILSTTNTLDSWATQGYKFIINGMNGQVKKQTMYSGRWDQYNVPDSLMEVSSVKYNYFEPGEPLTVLDENGETASMNLGNSSEIIAESKKISDETNTTSLSVELGITITYLGIPIPFTIPIPYKISDETHIYTHVTTQVDYCPAKVKSITNYQDGAYTTMSNLYFDKLTGDAIVTMMPGSYTNMRYSADGSSRSTHHGKYFSYNIPATFNYPGMGQKAGYENISMDDGVTMQVNGSDIYLQMFGSNYCDRFEKFTVGDFISVTSGSTTSIWNVSSISTDKIYLSAATNFNDTTFNSSVSVKILVSGRSNMLTLSSGNIESYGTRFNGLSELNRDQLNSRESLADYLNEALNGNSPQASSYPELNYVSIINEGICSACTEDNSSSSSNEINVQDITNILTDLNVDQNIIDDLIVWAGVDPDKIEYLYNYTLEYLAAIDTTDGRGTDSNTSEILFINTIYLNDVSSYFENSYTQWNVSNMYTNINQTTYLRSLFH